MDPVCDAGPADEGRNGGGAAPTSITTTGWTSSTRWGWGANVPIANGTSSDALLALLPDSGEWVTLRVPYPLGFYTRGLDGRIDDRNAGWKGRGVWASYDSVTNWHNEGGKGMTSEDRAGSRSARIRWPTSSRRGKGREHRQRERTKVGSRPRHDAAPAAPRGTAVVRPDSCQAEGGRTSADTVEDHHAPGAEPPGWTRDELHER